jgi:hypothetical protein
MAQATERSQMVAMRTNFLQKCGRPDYRATLDVCSPEHVHGYVEKMADNYNVLRRLHQGLYLVRGGGCAVAMLHVWGASGHALCSTGGVLCVDIPVWQNMRTRLSRCCCCCCCRVTAT